MPKVENFAQGTPCWVDLSTTDIEAAKAFYTKVFGWEYEANPMGPDMTYYIAKVNGSSVAGLAQQVPGMNDTMPPFWQTWLAVESADATAEKVTGAGGSLFAEPMDVPESGRMTIAQDPTGAIIGYWENKGMPGFGVIAEPGAVIWNELLTDDPSAAIPFYEKTLDIATKTEPFGEMGDYTQLMVNGNGVAGLMKKPMPDVPNVWTVYFHVTSADGIIAQTQELGGSVVAPVFDVPDIGRMAVLSDPQGATFCILEPSPNLKTE